LERGVATEKVSPSRVSELRNVVASKLILDCSPEQICGWLKTQYPDDESMRESHQTIYRSLFIQAGHIEKGTDGLFALEATHAPLPPSMKSLR
jgi:IS30 family transposase